MKFKSYDKKIETRDMVGKNYEYYEPIFKAFDEKGKQRFLNVPALIVTPFWCIYRRMIAKGATVIGIQVVLAMIAYTLRDPVFTTLYILSFLYYLYMGFYGNYEYYKRVNKLKKQGDEISVKYRHKFVNDKSGVDMFITICWVVGSIIIYIVALFT